MDNVLVKKGVNTERDSRVLLDEMNESNIVLFVQVGLGVHGEAGILRTEMKSARETIQIMLARMTNPDSATR